MRRMLAALLLTAVPFAVQAQVVRPPEDMARDATRKPAEMAAFAHVVPGAKVGDFIPGGGYFTRYFANIVGPTGHVTAIIPAAQEAGQSASVKAVHALADGSGGKISVINGLADPALANSFDVIWTSQNYHDLHNSQSPEGMLTFNKAVLAALKPGGVFVVLDHSAANGTGLTTTNTLHRIDAEAVKAEVVAAGFKFDGSSEVLRNPGDPRTAPVFDASIRGKTDQFVYRFRKP